ncbi:DJ-1/PfpI family protein [Iamia majanohamensis]|uniref:DJ-1/PfpI family protein n=1 Tax=Iamia majanohamensis TaxID=467976 RepID=A0AAF0BSG5_9ACTN|nr:DJ-1/PfpI family protein [Iamia majanohamensis]WCO68271.1 DJ-1/PfpI family protein [Iamia majanohamensis]
MKIALPVYPGLTVLDLIGPFQVLSQLPSEEVVLVTSEPGIVADDTGLVRLEVTTALADVPAPDGVVVPGGFGTRRLLRDGDPLVDWLAAVHPTTTFTASVCTGALLLGQAGILDGLEATTHWSAYDTLASLGATPTAERVVRRGKVWTAAGVSAGIDLALALVADLHDDDVARAVQLGIEYDPQPPFDAGSPSKVDPDLLAFVRAVSAEREAAALA